MPTTTSFLRLFALGTTQAHNVRAYLRLADVLGLYDARVPREILVCVRV